jgi:hypothetical protein
VYVAIPSGLTDNGKAEAMDFPPNAVATQASLAENIHARGHAEFSGSNTDFSIASAVMPLNRKGRVDFYCACVQHQDEGDWGEDVCP